MTSVPKIRYAHHEDLPQILLFIKAAAEEQSPGAVIAATEESLAKTMHLESPSHQVPPSTSFAWALLIESPEGQAEGLLIYYFNYSTWSAAPGICLEELYVTPEYRRHGYGRMLIEAMASVAEAAGCIKMDWVCLQNNHRALKFYERLGAVKMEDWTVLKVDREGIKKLAKWEGKLL